MPIETAGWMQEGVRKDSSGWMGCCLTWMVCCLQAVDHQV